MTEKMTELPMPIAGRRREMWSCLVPRAGPTYTYVMEFTGSSILHAEKGYPAAVLIRGVEAVSGPGRTTRHFFLNGSHNDRILSRVNGLWIEDDGFRPEPNSILATPRIGVQYAGPEWSAMPWRFVWEGS